MGVVEAAMADMKTEVRGMDDKLDTVVEFVTTEKAIRADRRSKQNENDQNISLSIQKVVALGTMIGVAIGIVQWAVKLYLGH